MHKRRSLFYKKHYGDTTPFALSGSDWFFEPHGYVCLFSLLAPKENRRKEMRFAAARFLPKIGRFSLKREKLAPLTPFALLRTARVSSRSKRHNFLTAKIARRLATSALHHISENVDFQHSSRRDDILLTPDKAVRPQSGVGDGPYTSPRHGRQVRKCGKGAAAEKGERNSVMSFIDPRRSPYYFRYRSTLEWNNFHIFLKS